MAGTAEHNISKLMGQEKKRTPGQEYMDLLAVMDEDVTPKEKEEFLKKIDAECVVEFMNATPDKQEIYLKLARLSKEERQQLIKNRMPQYHDIRNYLTVLNTWLDLPPLN